MGAPPVVEVEKHDDLRALLTANDPPPSEAVTSKTWSGLYRARAAAGLIPRLTSALGTASLGGTALAVGWKIGRTLDTKWLHFSYQEPAPDPSLFNPQAWQWDRWPTPLYCANGGPCVGTDQWVLDVGGGNVWVMQDREAPNPRHPQYWVRGDAFESYLSANPSFGTFTRHEEATPGTWACVSSYQGCFLVTRNAAQMEQRIVVDQPMIDWTTQASSATTTGFAPAADPGYASPEMQAARQAILADPYSSLEIGRLIDPTWEGEAFAWPAPNPTETYPAYVNRLRADGWLGTATVDELSPLESDPAYGPSGIPCTTVENGDVIGSGSAVTFYRNSTVFSSDEHGSGGGSCGGGDVTSLGDPLCEFNDAISNDTLKGSWEETIAAWGPYVLDQECAAAWQMLRDLGVLDQDGNLTMAAVSAAEPMDMRILNPTLVKLLPQYGSDIEFWRKVFIDRFNGIDLVTPDGHGFELHFYRDFFSQTHVDHDFKIVFVDWFH
jgi:hypothetical protein